MIRASSVRLIQPLPDVHGVYDAPAVEMRELPCDVRSVTRTEAYTALSHGLRPAWVLVLADYAEYHDEERCLFEGNMYKIVRTYVSEDSSIELVVEREERHDI